MWYMYSIKQLNYYSSVGQHNRTTTNIISNIYFVYLCVPTRYCCRPQRFCTLQYICVCLTPTTVMLCYMCTVYTHEASHVPHVPPDLVQSSTICSKINNLFIIIITCTSTLYIYYENNQFFFTMFHCSTVVILDQYHMNSHPLPPKQR